jgi:cobalt-zinc-cadmium efflux system membrane fusion protein
VAPEIDPVSHRLPVRAEVDNTDGALKPEMFASFIISADDSVTRPAVPDSAVIYDGSDTRVWVQGPDGSIAARSVRLGRSAGGKREVLDGLSTGEKIVTSGTLFIDRAASSD